MPSCLTESPESEEEELILDGNLLLFGCILRASSSRLSASQTEQESVITDIKMCSGTSKAASRSESFFPSNPCVFDGRL